MNALIQPAETKPWQLLLTVLHRADGDIESRQIISHFMHGQVKTTQKVVNESHNKVVASASTAHGHEWRQAQS